MVVLAITNTLELQVYIVSLFSTQPVQIFIWVVQMFIWVELKGRMADFIK